jgi:hypothetical protein
MNGWQWENIATLVCTTILVLGLYWLSGSWHALWGALLLLNINYVELKHKETGPGR